ncbi:hypothetical protein [uncultured Treponema sp.]|uniref:hypothetical protein n=1 Tax=uncultured Treponema sp. TaxID=162155 RepID=UPI0025F807B4|nr:hypothetical protein [uncultured Treponema sp.]
MEAHNYFTCIAYDSVDFLIQSKYVEFGIYIDARKDLPYIEFNDETLPHIHIGSLLETEFSCKAKENCNVVLVMKIQDFASGMKEAIEEFTETNFPMSGNFALSVTSSISSGQIDISALRLLPEGLRKDMLECGICALGFIPDENNKKLMRKQILISPDKLLRKFFSTGLLQKSE